MAERGTLFYDFDRFRVDVEGQVLLRDGRLVALTPKAFATLLALVERSGRVVGKDELLEAVWPDTFVGEATLTQNVYTLRRALAGAGGDRRLIETVPRRGYRLTVPAQRVAAPPPAAAWAGPDAGAAALRGARTIAVLPFHVLGIGGDAEVVSIGMADALITRLSNLRQLTVRPTSAVLRDARGGRDPAAIGRALKVEAVLEGTVQAVGERGRVSVQLVDVRDGAPFWAERFDAPAKDAFALQDSISEQVAQALRLELTGPERRRLVRRHTESPAAYEAYVRGRYFWNKRTGRDLETAIRYFRRAVELDPAYARAYAGLADSYVLLPLYASTPAAAAFPEAIAAARRALELDDGLAEAHTTLAYARCFFEWDWEAAEAGFRRAVELNSDYPTAYHWHSFYLAAMGRHEEALASGRRAHELDPLSLVITTDLGFVHYFARRFDAAIEHHLRALELEPDFPYALFALSFAYLEVGRRREAVDAARRAVELTGGANSAMLANLGHALGASGETAAAREVLGELERRAAAVGDVPASRFALVHLPLGDADAAFDRLAQACRERSRFVVFLGVWPIFDRLRADPRFEALLARVGLPVSAASPG